METPIDLKAYKRHARILEVRLYSIRLLLVNHYGEEKGMDMIRQISDMLGCTWQLLAPVFTAGPKLRKGAIDPGQMFNKQEMILASHIFGEDRSYVARKYLRASTSYIYQNAKDHSVDKFITEEWLAKLDRQPIVITTPVSQRQALDFVEKFHTFVQMIKV